MHYGVVTMKRHKMVNLCPTTYEIASKMKNFSKYVRDQLLKQDERNTFQIKYHIFCPDHPDFYHEVDKVPVFMPHCITCNKEMVGKWVNV